MEINLSLILILRNQFSQEMYPEAVRLGSTRSLKVPLDSAPEAFEEKKDMFGMNGLPGSFRKLEID